MEEYNIFDKKENRYMYKLSRELIGRKEEAKVSLRYISAEDQEVVKGFIKEKRQREEWIVEHEEQPVIEPEVKELIEQWRDEKYEEMRKLEVFMRDKLKAAEHELSGRVKETRFQAKMDEHLLSVARKQESDEPDPEKKKAHRLEIEKREQIWKER